MKVLVKIIENGISRLDYHTYPLNFKQCIDLCDSDDNMIFVDDILYDSTSDTYFTVFKVPGGFAIESNPKSFGLYDENDQFPVYESTGDAQTSSYVKSNCVVVGNISTHQDLYNKIKSDYEKRVSEIGNRR